MIETTMHALFVDDFATGEFRNGNVPVPTPGAGEVLIKVAASGVNPIDSKIRMGRGAHTRPVLPVVLGADVAGTVVALGEGTEGFQLGDEVYGMVGGVGGIQGTLAQYVLADVETIAPKPQNLSMREAAALPVVTLTAWEGLVDRAHIQKGQSVLVLGGSGGVGHIAVQLAKAFGAEVFATASPRKHAVLQGYGAVAIDRDLPIAELVQIYSQGTRFDLVYDTVGGKVLDDAFAAVRNYGQVVSCYGWGEHLLRPLSMKNASYSGVFVFTPLLEKRGRGRQGQILREAATLAESGQLRPVLDERSFSLDSASDAHALVDSGDAIGKVVIDVL